MSVGLKTLARELLPKGRQVPVKYWYHRLRGTLEPEMDLLEKLIRRGSRAIDVGGNRGVYAYRLWKLGALVEVFEPNPTCVRVLEAWASGKSRLKIHSVALSDGRRVGRLHIPIDEFGIEHDASASIEHAGFARQREQLVNLQTLDSYCFSDVDLIKIDVEGHEYSVIAGTAATIAASKPALLVEIEQRHSTRPIGEVFRKILDLGYRGYFRDNVLLPLDDFDVTRDQIQGNLGRRGKRYINNFLFLHEHRLARREYEALVRGGSVR